MVANSKPKLSWSTQATRSAGVSRSSTTASAMLTVSASATSSAGSGCSSATSTYPRGWAGHSGTEPVKTEPGGHRGEPAGNVGDLLIGTVEPEPDLLDDSRQSPAPRRTVISGGVSGVVAAVAHAISGMVDSRLPTRL